MESLLLDESKLIIVLYRIVLLFYSFDTQDLIIESKIVAFHDIN